MKVARWGNSLAVRLPRPLVEALDLREGDEVSLAPAGERTLSVSRDDRRNQIVARIRAMRRPLPADYRFDRADVQGRNGFAPHPDMKDEH